MNSEIESFTKGLEAILADNRFNAVLGTTHYPEVMRAGYLYGGSYADGIMNFNFGSNDGMRVMKREFLNQYINTFTDENALVFRLEDWNRYGTPHNVVYAATKEQFIHFDGYVHVKIGPDVSPPIEIPPGFFEGEMTIRYGFDDRDPDCVNINPAAKLYAGDVNGADYKFTLGDIPLFWNDRIKEIKIADGIDQIHLQHLRDLHIINKTKVKIDWSHACLLYTSPSPRD